MSMQMNRIKVFLQTTQGYFYIYTSIRLKNTCTWRGIFSTEGNVKTSVKEALSIVQKTLINK